MIKGIIFDLDGTLVHLPIRYDIIRKELQKLFNTNNEFIPLIPSILKIAANSDMVDRAFKIICKQEVVATNKLEIVEGAVDILNYLNSQKFLLGLVTLQCRRAAEKIISKMGTENLFSYVLTRDESNSRVDQLEKTLKELHLSSDEVIMIGDRLNDVTSATKVGLRSILVGKKKLEDNLGKVLIVERLSELKSGKFFKV